MAALQINLQPEKLEDRLVKLVPLKSTDFEQLFKAASDPLIWEQHPTSDRYKKEVFREYFDGAMASKTAFLILDKATNAVIGCTRFYDYQPVNKSIAIGYTFLTRNYWGGTVNGAVKQLLLTYAFQFADKVYFHIGAENIRSQKAVAKIGAVKTGEISFENLLHYEYVIQKPLRAGS